MSGSSDASVEDRIPRRELLTLFAYVHAGSHKAAAHRLGIAESTCRQRMSSLLARIGVGNVAQAVWLLRRELEVEDGLQDGRSYGIDTGVRSSPRKSVPRAIA